MTQSSVSVEKGDGSETFTLKCSRVEEQKGLNVIVRAIISAIGGLTGTNPKLQKVTYKLQVTIANVDAGDYPNSATYSDHDRGMAIELSRAVEDWGLTTSGSDTLYWDGRTINGAFANANIIESLEDDGGATRDYNVTIEWVHYDVSI